MWRRLCRWLLREVTTRQRVLVTNDLTHIEKWYSEQEDDGWIPEDMIVLRQSPHCEDDGPQTVYMCRVVKFG